MDDDFSYIGGLPAKPPYCMVATPGWAACADGILGIYLKRWMMMPMFILKNDSIEMKKLRSANGDARRDEVTVASKS